MQRNDWDLPEPPGSATRRPWLWGWLAAAILVPIALLVGAYLPIPIFYSYLPGPVQSIEELVDVDGSTTYSSEGALLMTTVSIDTEVTLFDVVRSWIDPDKELVLRQEVTGGGSLEDQLRQQRQEMRDSKKHAREVALTALGLGEPKGKGARVLSTVEGFPAEGQLEQGDVVLAIDGIEVDTTCDVGNLIDAHRPGETIRITIERNGTRRTIAVEAARNPQDPGAAFVGIVMEDVDYRFAGSVDVDFDTGRIAGPSAGLMMALALYDRLTPDDLTGGARVAGTGTIACDGGVGPIGGVEQKVAGAEEQGADVFLSPEANATAARRAAGDIEVVAVSSFDEALDYLEGRNQGGS